MDADSLYAVLCGLFMIAMLIGCICWCIKLWWHLGFRKMYRRLKGTEDQKVILDYELFEAQEKKLYRRYYGKPRR